MKKKVFAVFFAFCVLTALCAPPRFFAEEKEDAEKALSTAYATEKTENTTADGYSDVVAVAPTPSNGLKNVLLISAMGAPVVLVCLIYIYRAKKELSSPKKEE